MTTIINTPTPAQSPEREGSGTGFFVGIVVFLVLLVAIVYFGIPAINRMQRVDINIPAPQVTIDAPQVIVPDKVEVVPAE